MVTSLILPQSVSNRQKKRILALFILGGKPLLVKISEAEAGPNMSHYTTNTDSSTTSISEAKDDPTQYNLPPKKRADWNRLTDLPSHAQ